MEEFAHIFNPINTSLEARAEALRNVINLQRSLSKSDELTKDINWNDRIGRNEDINIAKIIIENSFEQAEKSLSPEDLKNAREKNLFSRDDLKVIRSLQAKLELKQHRENQDEHSHSHSKK